MFSSICFFLCIQACLSQTNAAQDLRNIAPAGRGLENPALRQAAANTNSAGYGAAPSFTPGAGYGKISDYASRAGCEMNRVGHGMRAGSLAGESVGATGYTGAYSGVGTPAPTSFGGVGDGNMLVSGDFDVNGMTKIYGALPILGSVSFNGTLPASGTVSVVGKSECRFF